MASMLLRSVMVGTSPVVRITVAEPLREAGPVLGSPDPRLVPRVPRDRLRNAGTLRARHVFCNVGLCQLATPARSRDRPSDGAPWVAPGTTARAVPQTLTPLTLATVFASLRPPAALQRLDGRECAGEGTP